MGLSDNVAIVALVVSVVALIGTTLQVVQQYMASAAGYSNLEEEVIGVWHTSKKRNFRLSEMRFRVAFETPVFFVCAPDNPKGPIKHATIYYIKGTDKSYEETRAGEPHSAENTEQTRQGTFYSRGARQITGLSNGVSNGISSGLANGLRQRPAANNLQVPPIEMQSVSSARSSMQLAISRVLHDEKGVHTTDSEMSTWVRMLQQLQFMERESYEWQQEQFATNPGNTFEFEQHGLCVALQAKRQVWDTMPSGIKRPYATTTITHLVEMAAMLGIYWKEFDRSAGRYRAEGNGYMLTGSHMAELGIVFTFQICGKSQFQENRLIPTDEIKELAFGFVPTLFSDGSDIRRLAFPTDDVHDLAMLQLGSRNELAETLIDLGCNTSTSNCVRDETKKHGHLFPLAFEIVGMLGKRLHMENSLYRLLPNPTFYHWDKKYFSLRLLLIEYLEKIHGGASRGLDPKREQIKTLIELSREVVRKLELKAERDLANGQRFIFRPLLDSLHSAVGECDSYLKKRKKVVELVLREHIQELLLMVNSGSDYDVSDAGTAGLSGTASGAAGSEAGGEDYNDANSTFSTDSQANFDGLMHASPETRQKTLMDIYFATLRRRVTAKANKALTSRWQYERRASWPQVDEHEANDVWCTLVFRMMCWLLLHDFNKSDVQLPKSELRGNRQRVCII